MCSPAHVRNRPVLNRLCSAIHLRCNATTNFSNPEKPKTTRCHPINGRRRYRELSELIKHESFDGVKSYKGLSLGTVQLLHAREAAIIHSFIHSLMTSRKCLHSERQVSAPFPVRTNRSSRCPSQNFHSVICLIALGVCWSCITYAKRLFAPESNSRIPMYMTNAIDI